MLDAVTVQHQTGAATDGETGAVTPTYATVYTGKAKIQQAAPASNPSEVGEASVFVGQLTLHLPVTDDDGGGPAGRPGHHHRLRAGRVAGREDVQAARPGAQVVRHRAPLPDGRGERLMGAKATGLEVSPGTCSTRSSTPSPTRRRSPGRAR
jgi:hypothetical protein